MPFGGLLTVGLIGAGGGLLSGIFGASAAEQASQQQAAAEQNAIQEQEREFNTQQTNAQPFVSAGQSSIGMLMQDLQNGTFGPGSLPAAPQYTGGSFTAPTLADAQASPGYQFTAQQGNKGILEGAAAAGGAISGGTLRSLDQFNTGLADSTYNDVFNRALATYNTGIQGYQAQLAGYGASLAGQQQEFGQLTAPAQIGSGSTASLNATGASTSSSIAQLMAGIGSSQAAGTVGAANALSSGLGGATNSITQSLLLSKLLGPTQPSQVMNSVPMLPGQTDYGAGFP